MSSRQMIHWRVYVYANNLYSLSGHKSLSYRDCSPIALRQRPNELHRILDFANRDLSVLKRHSEIKLINVFEVLQDLLLEVSLDSDSFKEALTPYLALATPQFVHELYNFARSPYDELISYDCNVQYRARELREEEKYEGSDEDFLVLPGIQSFPDFSRRIDTDECFDLGFDFDVEDEDYNLSDLSAPMVDELRRILKDRPARQSSDKPDRVHAAIMAAIINGDPNSTNGASTSAAAAAAAAAAANNNASSRLNPNDFGLEMAVERSLLDRNGNRSSTSSNNNNNEATPSRRHQRSAVGRSMPLMPTDAAAVAVARNASGAGAPSRPRSSVAQKRRAHK